jgi:hypothetical protein
MKREAVLIVGMHRSGTTVLMKAIEVLGYDSGKVVGGKYRENLALQAVSNELLRAFGMDWRSLKLLPRDWQTTAMGRIALRRATDAFQKEFDADRIVVKDPRMCRTLPIMLQAAAISGRVPRVIRIVRHREEVARSLEKRNGMSFEDGLALCDLYNVEAKFNSPPETVLLQYEMFLENWRRSLTIAGFRWGPEEAERIGELVDPAQRHHVAS